MDTQALTQFLVDSNLAGYAGGDEKQWTKETDGSTTIQFEQGEWKSHDNFFGGEPYSGRIVVFYKGKAVWMMVYYGWVEADVDPDTVYALLRSALKQMPSDYPFRGPREYSEGELIYKNDWTGDVSRYSGTETISKAGKGLYRASYLGGVVDQRTGL